MSVQARIAGVAVLAALATATMAAVQLRSAPLTAGFWFEDVSAAAPAGVAERAGGPLTAADISIIETVARRELDAAFAGSRVRLSASRSSMYRVRVLDRVRGTRMLPVAGASRALPGRRGDGAVDFSFVAASAAFYTPIDTTRRDIIEAIGRGVGRTAAHEFAHQIAPTFPFHQTTDKRSYGYAHLRAEHFYGELRWGAAAWRQLSEQ
jgi:hypothetical protein